MTKRFYVKGAIIILIIGLFAFSPQSSFSASVLTWNQTKWAADTNMDTICMGGLMNTGTTGKVFEFVWPSGFDLSGLTISDTAAASEFEIYIGHADCTGTARIGELTETADNDRDLVEMSGQLLRVTMEDEVNDWFSFKIVDKTDANTDTIITPAAGNYFMPIYGKQTASGVPTISLGDFIYVGGANEVNISASVDPTLTFELSDTSCALGTMTPSDIKTCQYSTTVSTNAVAGYTSYIKADGEFRKGSDSIAAVADGAVTAGGDGAGHGEYGVSQTNGAGGLDIDRLDTPSAGYCTSLNDQHALEAGVASALSTSDQSYALSLSPVDGEETTLCHSVGIDAATPAGTYSQLVTLTIVANF